MVRFLSNTKYSTSTMLMASAVDRLSLLWWSKTKDGHNNQNRPKMFVEMLTGKEQEKELMSFKSGAEFKKYRQEKLKKRLINGGQY